MRYFFTYLEDTEEIEADINHFRIQSLLYDEILSQLRDSNVSNFQNNLDTIKFKAPVFRFVWNGFNLFNPVSNGEIKFTKSHDKATYVTYKFYFWEFFIYAILFSTIPIFSTFLIPAVKILLLLIIWIIYALSTLLAAHRFENFMKKRIEKYTKSAV
jgi:hypothetical protein